MDGVTDMPRPRKEIKKEDFEGLLAIQCTLSEVAAYFDHKLNGCSEDTIERWCKRTYHKSFAEVSAIKKEYGKISLRRYQLELAKKSAAMAIFLGKNWLGQKDTYETTQRGNGQLADLIDGLKEPIEEDVYEKAENGNELVAEKQAEKD